MTLRPLIFLLPLFLCSALQAAAVSTFPTFGLSYLPPKDASSRIGLPLNVIGHYVFDKTSPFAGAELTVEFDPSLNGKTLADLATVGSVETTIGGEKALKNIATTVKAPVQRNIRYVVIHENRVYRFTATSPEAIDVSGPIDDLLASTKFIPIESADNQVNDFSKAPLTLFGLCSFTGAALRVKSKQTNMIEMEITDLTTDRGPIAIAIVRNSGPSAPKTFAEVRDRFTSSLAARIGLSAPPDWQDHPGTPGLHVSSLIKHTFPQKNGAMYVGYARFCILELGNGKIVEMVIVGVVTPKTLPAYVAATDQIIASFKPLQEHIAAADPNAR